MSTLTVHLDTRQVEHVLDAMEKFVKEGIHKSRPLLGRLLNNLGESVMDKVPVCTGTLKHSKIQEIRESGGQETHVRISFGGLASKYAEAQHERTDYAHTIPDAQAKGRLGPKGTRTLTNILGVKRKHPLRGYKGGQAKFLYGAPNSAWNPAVAQRWARLLDMELGRIAERDIHP